MKKVTFFIADTCYSKKLTEAKQFQAKTIIIRKIETQKYINEAYVKKSFKKSFWNLNIAFLLNLSKKEVIMVYITLMKLIFSGCHINRI